MNNRITTERITPELFNEFISLWQFSAYDNNPEIFQGYLSKSLFSYIFLEESKPIGAFGLVPFWAGVGEAWLMSTPQLEEKPLFMVKYFRRLTEELHTNGKLHRVQIMVNDTPALNRWAEVLGFTKEGVLRKYGLNGENQVMYSKIWD